ncbi:MAG: helix-turn-helix domain-containing protein [Hyphomicrobiaceae bacterium]
MDRSIDSRMKSMPTNDNMKTARDRSLTRQPNAIDVHVGMRLRKRRLFLGLSQDDLAKMLGVAFQQIQKYETGETRISASRLYDMGQALEVSVAWFFAGEATEGSAFVDSKKHPESHDDRQKLISHYNSIKQPALRRKLIEIASIFAEQIE